MPPAEVDGFTEKIFRSSYASIHYAEGPANGPPLLLLHGLARDWRSFSVMLPELSSRFHVFALDLRGHGGSSHVPHSYRMTQFVGDIVEFLRKVLPNGAAIFGHSLGGTVGMGAAADQGCRVTALIVGDTTISPENFSSSMYAPIFSQLHAIMLRDGSQTEMAREIGRISFHVPGFDETVQIGDLPGNDSDSLMEWARCAGQTDPDALAMTLEGSAFECWDPVSILPRIACPTLLLQGNPEMGALLSDGDVRVALDLLPRGECTKFPLLGHALFMQQAKPVLRAVSAFVEKHI